MTKLYISDNSRIPKYRQIVKMIKDAVDNRHLIQGEQIPSMNRLQSDLSVSRETVYKAYKELKMLGIISSSPGKGFYISKVPADKQRNIFLLFDNFTAYKDVLYSSIKDALGDRAVIDLYFHHFNSKMYRSLITEAVHHYTDYVIMPLFDEEHRYWLRETLKNSSVYLLDTGWNKMGRDFPSVCQNFEKEIYESLCLAENLLKKYNEITLIWGDSDNKFEKDIKNEMVKGLKKFARQYNYAWKVIPNADNIKLKKGKCFIVSYDSDLVKLVKQLQSEKIKLGKDVGIVSFNETPLKEISAGGITTFSTDFKHMGWKIGELLLEKKNENIENPFILIKRKSL